MFALRRVLTLCEAELVEPDVACSSVNFKGPRVQEAAFNSQMLESAKMMLSLFKRGEALGPKGGPPQGHWAEHMLRWDPKSLFPTVYHFCLIITIEKALKVYTLYARDM